MRYDTHTHAFHPKIAAKVLDQLHNHYDIEPVGLGTVEDLLRRAGAAGLDRVLVHTAATAPDQVVPANNWSLELNRRHPEIVAFGTLHPDYADNAAEIARLRRNGVRGLKFHPDFQGFFLDDPAFYALMELVPDDFTLMIHIGDRLPPKDNPSCPFKLRALRRAFPGPRIIAPHFGGYLHWDYVLEALAGEDVFIDTSSALPFMDAALARTILKRHGLERMLFGSDYPLFDPGAEIERAARVLGLAAADLDALLGNGSAVLGEDGDAPAPGPRPSDAARA